MKTPLLDKKIVIACRSFNDHMYQKAMGLFDVPWEKLRIKDSTAEDYIYHLIEDIDADYIINVDEDAYLFDQNELLQLLAHIVSNNIAYCGIPDGGVHMRCHNPYVANPYFSILNVKRIREQYLRQGHLWQKTFGSMKWVKWFDLTCFEANRFLGQRRLPTFPFLPFRCRLINMRGRGFKSSLRSLSLDIKGMDFKTPWEPYYNVMLWVAKTFDVYYLNTAAHSDKYTSIVYSQNNKPFLLHTWFARAYTRDGPHKTRIDAIIREAYEKSGISSSGRKPGAGQEVEVLQPHQSS